MKKMMTKKAMPKAMIQGKYKEGGAKSKFGLLSVIAGIDNNPKPTAADRIAGAKKKMKRVKKAKK